MQLQTSRHERETKIKVMKCKAQNQVITFSFWEMKVFTFFSHEFIINKQNVHFMDVTQTYEIRHAVGCMMIDNKSSNGCHQHLCTNFLLNTQFGLNLNCTNKEQTFLHHHNKQTHTKKDYACW